MKKRIEDRKRGEDDEDKDVKTSRSKILFDITEKHEKASLPIIEENATQPNQYSTARPIVLNHVDQATDDTMNA